MSSKEIKMKSSIIGERLTVATFLLILSASMVGLSLSIKNSEQQPLDDKNTDANLNKLGVKEYSNKEKETFGCECMLRTVSISFRNYGLLADLDQVMFSLPKNKINPVEKEPQENVRNTKKKFLHGICPDKFRSEKRSYPSVSSAQAKYVSNNSRTLNTTNVREPGGSIPISKTNDDKKEFDPWSVNVARCLGICSTSTPIPMKGIITNKSFQDSYSSTAESESKRTNSFASSNSNGSTFPAMNEDTLNGTLFRDMNLLLPPQRNFVCKPTLSKRKRISIRIPWNKNPSDLTPSKRKTKIKNLKAKSDSSNENAQKRSSNVRNKDSDVNYMDRNMNEIEEALTIFSEVEEHLACSCQDPNSNNNYNNKLFNSERLNEENIKSAKGEKISSKPSKGRTRRSALNMKDSSSSSNTEDMYGDSFNVNEEVNSQANEDSSSNDWMRDFDSKSNVRDSDKDIFHKYIADSDDDTDNYDNVQGKIKKSTSTSSTNHDEENRLQSDNEYGNTTNDDGNSLYYSTCLACREATENCEKTGQIYDPSVCHCVFPASRTFLNSFYTLGVVMLTVMVCCFLVFGVQKGDENVLNTSRQSTRRSTSTGRRRSGGSYHQHERSRDYTTTNSFHPRLAVATEDGDCELGGTTTILQHNPGQSPLRIIERGRISSDAVCHTHPNKKAHSSTAIDGDETLSNKNTKNAQKLIRPVSVSGGGGGIAATAAASVVASAASTSFGRSTNQTNTNDVEL